MTRRDASVTGTILKASFAVQGRITVTTLSWLARRWHRQKREYIV